MKLHYGGKFNTEEDLKTQGVHHEGAVAFSEPSQTVFAIVANMGCIIVAVLLCASVYILSDKELVDFANQLWIAAIISLITLIPHEFLHAICFKEDVYVYYAPSKMMLFVHGTESMTKGRFVFMSLLPNIVFGMIPFVMFLFNHNMMLIGTIGAICISMGFGDYVNVFNAITQMPKGSKTYLQGFHSYWYK